VADDVILLDESFRGSIVLFALEREAKAFVRLYPYKGSLIPPGYCLVFGEDDSPDCQILVGMIGVGKPAARAATETLLKLVPNAQRVIVAGFAGALREGLPLAEVVVASDVVDEFGGRWATTWPTERSGRILTCERMIGEPALKKKLGATHQADAVDMESSAVAEVCHRHGIPFGCFRVVSDDENKPLSRRLMGLVESGRVRIWRVLWEVLRSPRMGVELIRLAKHTRFAADRLAQRLRFALGSTER
jgi:adenosylhomocysteine nucleosidase